MRVVGYVRESRTPQEGATAFSQSEQIRRWIAGSGHQLIAVCQDVRQAGHALGREGYRALLGIIGAGQVDAVVVADLDSLSPDVIIQEVMLWDLRARGVPVLSANPDEVPLLAESTSDRTRMLIRDVLARVSEYRAAELVDEPTVLPVDYAPDVVVELLPAGDGESDDAGDTEGRARTS